MTKSNPSVELVVFDFDGTLAHRAGMWSQCFLDVLDAQRPGHGNSLDDLRAQLRDGFPWHDSGTPHTQIRSADEWWLMLGSLIDRVFLSVGAPDDELERLRSGVRSHYCDSNRFHLYSDVMPALQALRAAGIPVVILSNHVPELPAMTTALGLDDYVDRVFTSALIGYEKPHVQAFRIACGVTEPECGVDDWRQPNRRQARSRTRWHERGAGTTPQRQPRQRARRSSSHSPVNTGPCAQ